MPRKDSQREADKMLREVWAPIAGGPVTPVDPARIAGRLGVEVVQARLPREVSAAIKKELGGDPVILLNREDHPNRQRFSCAHELGHFVLRRDAPDQYDYIDYRDPMASTGTQDEEIFANGFAANLLMPEGSVRAAHREVGGSVAALAFRFRVSQDAMVNRLKNLGLKIA